MKYRVTLDGSEREIDVVIAPDGTAIVNVDGARVDCDARRIPGGVSLRIEGRVFDVLVGGEPAALQVAVGEARGVAEVVSPRMRARRKKSAGLGTDEKEIRAPMPGRVVKLLVGEGQEVAAGEPCVVVEAMKMENELRAPVAGTVGKIHVAEGAAVDGQTLLLTFA